MIQTLVNPKTELYYNFKNIIFSNNFPWFWQTTSTGELFLEGHTDISFYGHSLLCRPDELVNQRYTRPLSEHLETFTQIVDEIFEYNGITDEYFFLRSCINCVHPKSGIQYSVPHFDHGFPHENLIIYLTDSGGSTYVEGEEYNPREDDVIIFSGKHYAKLPENDRRIIIVSTFMRY